MSRTTARRGGRNVQPSRARRNKSRAVGWLVGGLIVVLVAGVLVFRQRTPAVPGEERIADQGTGHINNPTDPHTAYNSTPPTSGIHWGGGTAPWDPQSQPVADELSVHNLEHGGIIIHYRQDIDQGTISQLVSLTSQLQRRNPCIALIPSPTDKINAPIVATAWIYLL